MLSERRLLILPNVLVLQIHVYVGKSLPEIIVVDELLHLNLIISKLPISAVARQNKLFFSSKMFGYINKSIDAGHQLDNCETTILQVHDTTMYSPPQTS